MREARIVDGRLEVVENEVPPLPSGWVRIAVEACGICGSDLHLLDGTSFALPDLVPGHEVVGRVVDGPAGLGDGLYAVEPRLRCGCCDACGTGAPHLCPHGEILGLSRRGGLAEWLDVPPSCLHPVPPAVGRNAASLAEPLAVCVRAIGLARLERDSRVLVLGGGSIGLIAGLLARDVAAEVAVAARHPHQRVGAQRLGLTALAEESVAPWAEDRSPDVVIETVGGRAGTVDQAIHFCRAGGRIVVLGVFAGATPLNMLALMFKELSLVGSNTYGSTRRGSEFRAAVDLLPRFQEELAALQTHRFELGEAARAFAAAADKRSGSIKVTVTPGR